MPNGQTHAQTTTIAERCPIDGIAIVAMSLLTAVWGTQQVAMKLATPGMGPLLQAGTRSGIASAVMLAVVVLRREQGLIG